MSSQPAKLKTKFLSLLKISVGALRKFEGSPDILAVEITLPALSPGEYDLEISVEDVGTDRRAAIRKALSVR